MRRAMRFGITGWLLGGTLVALLVYFGRRRGRLLLAAISGALTDRALRALADTFREDEEGAAASGGRP